MIRDGESRRVKPQPANCDGDESLGMLGTGPSTVLRAGPAALLRAGPSTLLRAGASTSLGVDPGRSDSCPWSGVISPCFHPTFSSFFLTFPHFSLFFPIFPHFSLLFSRPGNQRKCRRKHELGEVSREMGSKIEIFLCNSSRVVQVNPGSRPDACRCLIAPVTSPSCPNPKLPNPSSSRSSRS